MFTFDGIMSVSYKFNMQRFNLNSLIGLQKKLPVVGDTEQEASTAFLLGLIDFLNIKSLFPGSYRSYISGYPHNSFEHYITVRIK